MYNEKPVNLPLICLQQELQIFLIGAMTLIEIHMNVYIVFRIGVLQHKLDIPNIVQEQGSSVSLRVAFGSLKLFFRNCYRNLLRDQPRGHSKFLNSYSGCSY